MMIYQLIYMSSATVELNDNQLFELLETSRKNNEKLGITGLLLYHDNNFIQLLEGDKETVSWLTRKISQDTRHTAVRTLCSAEVKERSFADWSMSFRYIRKEDERQIPGFTYFLTEAKQQEIPASRAVAFLEIFKENIR